jgi:hypothetical protein
MRVVTTRSMNKPSSVPLDRRGFLGGALAASACVATGVFARPTMQGPGERLASELFNSLAESQRKDVCFAFDHPLRQRVENNWKITKPIDKTLNADQQDLARQIYRAIHSEEFAERAMKQFLQDNDNDFGKGSVAFFGAPDSGRFEYVFTGRHTTRRLDGDSVAGAAFGGPIFYGHAARSFYEKKDHPDNVYWFQAIRANELFAMLDGKQREQALAEKGRPEKGTKTVALKGDEGRFEGIAFGDLSADQKAHARKVLHDLLLPFRKEDRAEALAFIEAVGFDRHRIAFFRDGDIGGDKVWDVWQIEGPRMIWYFRGEPHVHTWVHIRDRV